jgi:hypothetical protein
MIYTIITKGKIDVELMDTLSMNYGSVSYIEVTNGDIKFSSFNM